MRNLLIILIGAFSFFLIFLQIFAIYELYAGTGSPLVKLIDMLYLYSCIIFPPLNYKFLIR